MKALAGSKSYQSNLTPVAVTERRASRSPLLPPQHGVTRAQRLLLRSGSQREETPAASAVIYPPKSPQMIQRTLFAKAKESSAFIWKMANDSPAKSLVDIDLASLRVSAAEPSRCFFLNVLNLYIYIFPLQFALIFIQPSVVQCDL